MAVSACAVFLWYKKKIRQQGVINEEPQPLLEDEIVVEYVNENHAENEAENVAGNEAENVAGNEAENVAGNEAGNDDQNEAENVAGNGDIEARNEVPPPDRLNAEEIFVADQPN